MNLNNALELAFSLLPKKSFPIDPIVLASRLELTLIHNPLHDGACYVQYHRSDCSKSLKPESSKIEYSYCLELHQRFAMTRAIGHHLLGHPSTSFSVHQTQEYDLDNNAQEAIRFALLLLIPEEKITKYMKSINSEEELARYFQVPNRMIHQRIAMIELHHHPFTPKISKITL